MFIQPDPATLSKAIHISCHVLINWHWNPLMELSLWFQTGFVVKSSCPTDSHKRGLQHSLACDAHGNGQQRPTGRRKRGQRERERQRERETAQELPGLWGERREGDQRERDREEEREPALWVPMEEWMGAERETGHQRLRDAVWNSASHHGPIS